MKAHITTDLYTILEIPRGASAKDIKSAYHRLARVRHPDRNRSSAEATRLFQDLQEAYEILSDPTRRSQYDAIYSTIRLKAANGGQQKHSCGINKTSSTQAKAATDHTGSHAPNIQRYKEQVEDSRERIKIATLQLVIAERNVEGDRHKLEAKRTSLKALQAEEQQHVAEDMARQSWFGSFWYSALSAQEEEERNRKSTSRRTAMLVIDGHMMQLEASVGRIEAEIQTIKDMIRKERNDLNRSQWLYDQAVAAAAENERAEKETAKRREQHEAERTRQEEAAQTRQRMQREREAAEERRRKRQEAQADEAKSEATAKESARREQKTNAPKRRRRQQNGVCRHDGWWTEMPIRVECERCHMMTRKFIFSCPKCQMKACATCRVALKTGNA